MRNRGWWLGGIIALVAALVTVGLIAVPGGHARAAPRKPNIVFVLTDDLDWSLVQYMPHVIQLERDGVTFDHYFVSDSLCCPSRSTIFTGLFSHDTGVVGNVGKNGGYASFAKHHDEKKTYAVPIRRAGYLTSMMGKYLNGYGGEDLRVQEVEMPTKHVPPGWSDWHVGFAQGYSEFNYHLNENRRITHYGHKQRDYLTDVLALRAKAFIGRAAAAHKPFVMEVATFAPHRKPVTVHNVPEFPYAPRDAGEFRGLGVPRDPSFNAPNVNAPSWLRQHPHLPPRYVATVDAEYRQRAQSVQAVDRLLGVVEAQLRDRGLAGNTYIVFSSDNGYHLGEHQLLGGKESAFKTDIHVPLIIAGPGVPGNRIVSRVVQNIDLNPTFVQIAGGRLLHTVDGHSLLPLLHPARDKPQLRWPTAALIEHNAVPRFIPQGNAPGLVDPDLEPGDLGLVTFNALPAAKDNPAPAAAINPRRYGAVRVFNRQLGNVIYVEYVNHQREYYNIDNDPYERLNIYKQEKRRHPNRLRKLHRILIALENCHNAAACWKAGQPQP